MKRFLILLLLTVGCASASKNQTKIESLKVEDTQIVSTEVTFEAAGTTVHGTLVTTKKPVAGVVFIAGSGPTDRNWESPMLPGDNGSARLLANALAESNVASLRYDKRGTGKTVMSKDPLAWSQYETEVVNAVAELEKSGIDRPNIYVAGHSEGGAHAIRTAQKLAGIGGIILLAAAGRPLATLVVEQIDKQLRAAGVSEEDRKAHSEKLLIGLRKIGAGKTIDPASASNYPGVQQLVAGMQSELNGTFAQELLMWDPVQHLQFDLPLMILNGDKDVQVTERDAKLLAAARPDGELVIVSNADHVLKDELTPKENLTAQLGLKYNDEGRKLAPGISAAIVSFIKSQR